MSKKLIFIFIVILFLVVKYYWDGKENFRVYSSRKEVDDLRKRGLLPRMGIVSTIKAPHQLEYWVNYYRRIGFDYFYLFDDDGKSVILDGKVGSGIKIRRYIYDDDYVEKLKKTGLFVKYGVSFEKEVMSRQILNCEIALEDGMVDGVDWLLSVDSDELLYFKIGNENIGSRVMDVPEDVDWLKILNYEVVVSEENVENCFKGLKYFKNLKGSDMFKAYGNGKGMVRVNKDMEPAGVHEFYNKRLGEDRHMVLSNTVILHYYSCRFDDWVKKYENLGDFPDHYWGNPNNNKVFDFHAKSRDMRKKDLESKKEFYQKEFMLSPNEINILLQQTKVDKINPNEWMVLS